VIPYVVASDIFDRQSIKERKKIKVIEIFYTLPIVLFHSEVRNTDETYWPPRTVFGGRLVIEAMRFSIRINYSKNLGGLDAVETLQKQVWVIFLSHTFH